MDLQEIGDRIAITELMSTYANALSTSDWSTWRATFADGAHADYSANFGPDGTVDDAVGWLEPMLASMDLFLSQATNVVVTFVDASTANVRSMFQATMRFPAGDPASQPMYVTAQGFYHDKVARTGEGWKLTERVEVPIYTRM